MHFAASDGHLVQPADVQAVAQAGDLNPDGHVHNPV